VSGPGARAASARPLPTSRPVRAPAPSAMVLDGRSLTDGHTVEADVCIVGAGAAGITLAREFVGAPFRV
jgi:choline dehydrogenase-like flavoprotein